MRAIGYIRVSTEEQARSGLGLEDQRRKIAAYAEIANLTIVRIEADEGISGATMDRPGLKRALQAIGSGEADALVALKLDRLSRSTRDILALVDASRENEWRLVSVSESLDTGTPAGRMVLTVLAAMAQMERELISERTKAALAVLKSRGVKLGRPALHVEAGVLELAGEMREASSSLRSIAAALNAEGFRTALGSAYTHVQVGALLRRGPSTANPCACVGASS